MTLLEKQSALREKFLVIDDAQERLASIVSRKPRIEPLRDAERIDANLVKGCVSRVWLVGDAADGVIHLRMDAEAGMVKGLAAFLCELYDGAVLSDASTFEPTLLEDMDISRMLSPTRLHGLQQVCARIRALARE